MITHNSIIVSMFSLLLKLESLFKLEAVDHKRQTETTAIAYIIYEVCRVIHTFSKKPLKNSFYLLIINHYYSHQLSTR